MIYAGKSIQVVGLDDHIAELSFNAQGAPVNVFSVDVVAELSAALDALEADFTCKGLIVTSAKQVFIAGADITEFLTLFQSGAAAIKSGTVNNNRNYNRLEELTMPVVAAINGAALGGGFELCLSCDYRIASFNALIGLPECSLGIIPGWGGTVRLPRIAGFETAVEWIAFAQHQNAETGLKAGVLDAVVAPESLRAAALRTVRQCLDGTGANPWRTGRRARQDHLSPRFRWRLSLNFMKPNEQANRKSNYQGK